MEKIPSKKYLLIIGGIILISIGIPSILNGLSILTPEHFEQVEPLVILIGVLIPVSIGMVPILIGIFLIRRSRK